jgi:hypothetical protein
MDRDIEDLCGRLRSADVDDVLLDAALLDAASLLDRWATRERTRDVGPLKDDDARAGLREALIDRLSPDPTHERAGTVVWLLGKLFDASLEPYFAELLEIYLREEDHFSHLHQTLIALDNLDAINAGEDEERGWTNSRDSFSRMQRIGAEYLRKRAERSS